MTSTHPVIIDSVAPPCPSVPGLPVEDGDGAPVKRERDKPETNHYDSDEVVDHHRGGTPWWT